MVKNNSHSNGLTKEAVKETEAALSEKQKELKNKRAIACWDKIQIILTQDNCEIIPQITIIGDKIQSGLSVIAK